MKKSVSNFALLLLLLAAATAHWGCEHQPTLPELQRKCLLAKTEEAKAAVVAELEQYYHTLPVSQALRDSLEKQVAAQIDTTKINWTEDAGDTNAYRMESCLQSLLTLAAIARGREEVSTFQSLMERAKVMAKAVDKGTQNDYWVAFVERFGEYTRAELLAWLKAKKAEELCRAWQNDAQKFSEAEAYAAMGLLLLQQSDDQRLRLDFFQRLLWILYQHHSHYDLVETFTGRIYAHGEGIKYHLRAAGFLYAQAEALRDLGRVQEAYSRYVQIIAYAAHYARIENMNWYARNALLRKGDIDLAQGEFDLALQACREAEGAALVEKEILVLRILKFNVLLETGLYEQAQTELQKALALAQKRNDAQNIMQCYNNFGVMHARLTNYDSALVYYERARACFPEANTDLKMRLTVLGNIADVLAIKKDSAGFEVTIKEAQRLLELTDSPRMKARVLHNIALRYQLSKRFAPALKYHAAADSIARANTLLDFLVTIRLDEVDCLTALEHLQEAQALLDNAADLADEIGALEGRIEVLDRAVQLHYRTGRCAQAQKSSRRLLAAIEEMSRRFANAEHLLAYRQKVYHSLKNAALCDIAVQDRVAAFSKLTEAKAYALKHRLWGEGTEDTGPNLSAQSQTLIALRAKLRPRQLLLDFMLTPDSLYVFALGQGELRLLRKGVDFEKLRLTARAFLDSTVNTARLMKKFDSERAKKNFAGAARLGQRLYQALFDWPELTTLLAQTDLLYLVPDDFLFEIPFAALPAQSDDAQTFLVNRAAIAILPSASLLTTAQAANGESYQPQNWSVLLSVDTTFKDAPRFAATVKKLFPLTEELSLPDTNVTKEKVLRQLRQGHRIYIFLGHGKADAKHPNRGYIELWVKTPLKRQKVRLTPTDLDSITQLRAKLVMLIGCETAGGKLFLGSGISGLQQKFLALGAENIVANLWEVDAEHNIEQAENFLSACAKTWALTTALQESQRRKIGDLQTHPFYQYPFPYFWGSMVLLTATPH